jgi:hypothetical protein
MGNKQVLFLSIGIFIHSFAFSQLSGKNRATNFYFNCSTCEGKKGQNKQETKLCSNCSYWTSTQRQYNYCNVCRNSRIIVTKYYFEKCGECNGTGKKGGLVNRPLFDIATGYLTKSEFSELRYLTKGIFLDRVIHKGLLLFKSSMTSLTDSKKNTLYDLLVYDDGRAVLKTTGNSGDGDYKMGVYNGIWQIQNNEFHLNIKTISINGQDSELDLVKSKNKY